MKNALQDQFPLGLGTSRLCSLNGGLSRTRATALVEHAFDAGIRFVDTAPCYGQGQAEEAIGHVPSSIRDELTLCTKVGYSYGLKGRLINQVKPVLRPALKAIRVAKQMVEKARASNAVVGTIAIDIAPETIRTHVQGSLARLRRERVDVLLLHDPSLASLNDDNARELERLKQQGIVGSWGISTDNPQAIRQATGLPGIEVIQMPIYPVWLKLNEDLLGDCAKNGIAIIAHRVLTPLVEPPGSDSIASQQQVGRRNVARECLEFALRQDGVAIALCGTTSTQHLTENVDLVKSLSTAYDKGDLNADKPLTHSEIKNEDF